MLNPKQINHSDLKSKQFDSRFMYFGEKDLK